MTDATGHYRLSGLAPGRYAVAAATQRNAPVVKTHPEATAGEPQQLYSYGVQYYPGTDRAEAATLITVHPGKEISSIDFRLSAQTVASVEGKIIVPPGAGSVKDLALNMVNEDFDVRSTNGVAVNPPDYIFRSGPLAPGPYLLVAQASIDGR